MSLSGDLDNRHMHFINVHSVVLGKTPLSKKAHEKSLMSIEQGLMAGPNCQAGRGKDGAA
jgi:hypothetical protein